MPDTNHANFNAAVLDIVNRNRSILDAPLPEPVVSDEDRTRDQIARIRAEEAAKRQDAYDRQFGLGKYASAPAPVEPPPAPVYEAPEAPVVEKPLVVDLDAPFWPEDADTVVEAAEIDPADLPCVRYRFKRDSWWRYVVVPAYLPYHVSPHAFRTYCAYQLTDQLSSVGWKPSQREIARSMKTTQDHVSKGCRELVRNGVFSKYQPHHDQIAEWYPTGQKVNDPKLLGRMAKWWTDGINSDVLNGDVAVPEWAVWLLDPHVLVTYVHLLRRMDDPAGGAVSAETRDGISKNLRSQTFTKLDWDGLGGALRKTRKVLGEHLDVLELYGVLDRVAKPGVGTTVTVHPMPSKSAQDRLYEELVAPWDAGTPDAGEVARWESEKELYRAELRANMVPFEDS